MKRSIHIGFDTRQAEAFAVCRNSLRRHAGADVQIRAICLDEMRERGLYWRATSTRDGLMWDDISGATCSTEFAISRFLTPLLAGTGWALFMDSDILARSSIAEVFDQADPTKAIMCVKHDYRPLATEKMDGQAQAHEVDVRFPGRYSRKNWSSVMLFNCDHPANKRLTVDLINTVPGRDLHRFCWLEDDEIGALDPAWNFLVGHSDPTINAKLVHFTEGGPWFEGYRNVPYADEWVAERNAWARGEFQPIKEAA
jgi:hypothetical protein